MLSERWQGCFAQWACCLFWLCDFPLGINDFFDGSEDAFVPAWFWPFSKLGLFGFFIRWEHVGGSGVCSSLKKEKNAQTIRTKLVAKMLKLVRYQELPVYIQQNCDTGQEPPAVCLRARFDLF